MTKLKFKREYIAQEYTYDENYSNCKLIKEGEHIVRCSRCDYWHRHPLHYDTGRCANGNGGWWASYDFCSNGKEKE